VPVMKVHLRMMLAATTAASRQVLLRVYALAPSQRATQSLYHHSGYPSSYRQHTTASLFSFREKQTSIDSGTTHGTKDNDQIMNVLHVKNERVAMEDTVVKGHVISSVTERNRGAEETTTTTTNKQSIEAMRKMLKEELRRYRLDQSKVQGKLAYTVFTNASLDEICAILPTSKDELLDIKGIGKKKLEVYGEGILDIVFRYVTDGLVPSVQEETKGIVQRPAVINIESLTEEQQEAANLVLDTENPSNVFISGAAGTGKSYVLKYIIQTLQERQTRKCAPTAPTGVAAINVGGSTLHSFFGIGLGTGSRANLVKKVRKSKEAMKRIDETDVLLIDEVSMLSSHLLETLDAVARDVRKNGEEMNKPFGGMQIVCVGDFFQLPPIVQGTPVEWEGNRDDIRRYCFDSPVWDELRLTENTFELKNVQRQESGSPFEKFLNMVRVRDPKLTTDIIQQFNNKCLISIEHPLPNDGIIPTRLYTHNRNVDAENENRLAQLKEELVICKATDEWRDKMPTGTKASVKNSMKKSIATEMPDEVKLKVGAQVVLTRNRDLDRGFRGLVNGSRGVVERFVTDDWGDEIPIVRFDNGRIEKVKSVETMRYNPDGGPGCLVRKQIPLKLGWAMTVHKSQGSTLSRAILDISSTFEPGQAYVSLSRVKSIDGLWLERPVRIENIMVSKRVLYYYRYIT